MGWFKKHLNWTWIIVFILAAISFRYFSTPRITVYTDSNYTTVWDESNIPDISEIQWTPDSESAGWITASITAYLSNTGTAAAEVNVTNTKSPNLVQRGLSVKSDTVTIQPNEKKPIVIRIYIKPDIVSGDENIEFYFHTSEGGTSLPYQIPVFIILALYLTISGWVLRQKNRSLWYLLLLIIWAPLWLSNKSTTSQQLPTIKQEQ